MIYTCQQFAGAIKTMTSHAEGRNIIRAPLKTPAWEAVNTMTMMVDIVNSEISRHLAELGN